jgi:hypothetical protein
MKTMRWVLVAVAVLVVGIPTADAQMRGIGRINGFVVDDGGAPIEGVTVRTATSGGDLIEAQTDAKGKWTLPGIGRGEWLVTALKPGFTAKRLKVVVEREIDRTQDIKITLPKSA